MERNQNNKMRSLNFTPTTLAIIVSFLILSSHILKGQSRDASFSPDGSKIFYVSKLNGINQVFSMDIDGTNKKQITKSIYSNYYPFVSPNGDKVLLMSLQNEKTLICLMNVDGSDFKCLTNQKEEVADPNWFPDGSKIIFSANKEGNNEIYSMNLDGSNRKRLTQNDVEDQTPSISPNGKHVVFVSNRDSNNELYIMDLDGNNTSRLTKDPKSDRVPRWSADSKKIIWYSRESIDVAGSSKNSWNSAEIYEINLDGSNRKKLTQNHFRDQSPNYSPDGNKIVFTSKRTGKNEIFIMNADGTEVKQLTETEMPYQRKNVAIFLYDGVELLDFGGPAEVFAASGIVDTSGKWQFAYNVYTVAASKEQLTSQGFLKVIPDYSIADCPVPDIIVLPGGSTGKSRKNPLVINWIKENANQNKLIISVCTGAFLLGDAGLLKGKKATTWYGAIKRFSKAYPETEVMENVRFVDNGNIITTAGVSAGIDGALHLVSRLLGEDAARATAEYMEYDKWDKDAGYISK